MLDTLADLGAITSDRGMADPVFLDVDLSGAGTELPAAMPPELAELLGAAWVAADPAARERARAQREELTAGLVELIRLTELGTRAVRQRLLAVGRDAPLVGELAHAPAAGLLGVLADDYGPDAARVELAGWIAARGERDAALRQLTGAGRSIPFRVRAQAMLAVLLTGLPEGEGERLLHGLRGDPVLAPLVLTALAHHELLSPEDMTDAEHLLVLAESLLQLVELAGGGDRAKEVLCAQAPMPGTQLPPHLIPRTRTGPDSKSRPSLRKRGRVQAALTARAARQRSASAWPCNCARSAVAVPCAQPSRSRACVRLWL